MMHIAASRASCAISLVRSDIYEITILYVYISTYFPVLKIKIATMVSLISLQESYNFREQTLKSIAKMRITDSLKASQFYEIHRMNSLVCQYQLIYNRESFHFFSGLLLCVDTELQCCWDRAGG